ncbi:MAG: amidohydrolase family protein [Bacteroidales bacterium]|nr:amidohydrolase family protein [Bacteroidales bacterium]
MSQPVPIFDSLTHPTLDGNWIMPRYEGNAHIDDLLCEMNAYNVSHAFAVGMQGIGAYNEDAYINFIRERSNGSLFPIAYLPFDATADATAIKHHLSAIKRKGYVGVKIHPRISNLYLDNPLLPQAIDDANELGLAVLLCTYLYSPAQSYHINDIANIGELLTKIDTQSKVVLLHGGTIRLLEMMEIVRAFPNALLDLSFTLCKYAGSSLDLDLQFLFKTFDRRICIGSDYPEISLKSLRARFEQFADGLAPEKAENIAYKNLFTFLGL